MNLTVDKQGREEEYFLKEYTNSSEWGVINVHKVSLSVKERRVGCQSNCTVNSWSFPTQQNNSMKGTTKDKEYIAT